MDELFESLHDKCRKPRIMIGVTGSVATVKIPELAVKLCKQLNADVRLVLTHGAQYFWDNAAEEYAPSYWQEMQTIISKSYEETHGAYLGQIFVHEAEEEWKKWKRLGDPILHIKLRDWADIALLAPLSAHTLSKISNGLCDDPLSSCLRAWDLGHGTRKGKPILLAPAMNTAMWVHPLTKLQMKTIQSFWNSEGSSDSADTSCGIQIIPPQEKTLACGEVGDGALAPVDEIIEWVKKSLNTFGSNTFY